MNSRGELKNPEGSPNGDQGFIRSQTLITQLGQQAGHYNAQDEQSEHSKAEGNTFKNPSEKISELIGLFKISQVDSRKYREVVEDIAHSFTSIENLTTSLQDRVDHLLKLQQTEFVNSYILHMKRIQQEFHNVERRINSYEDKIKYYENEGRMSHLVIKCSKLEEECKNLYAVLAAKDKAIKDSELMVKVQRSELKRLQKEIKRLVRERNQVKVLEQKQKRLNENKNYFTCREDSEKDFEEGDILAGHKDFTDAYNVNPSKLQDANINLLDNSQSSPSNKNDVSTEENFKSLRSQGNLLNNKHLQSSERSMILDGVVRQSRENSLQQKATLVSRNREAQLQRELNQLRRKNQKLHSIQSYILDSKNDSESFFISCVNEIKQQIRMRKKINHCTLEEFKKEDKIQLLVKVLSNDDILSYLHEKIFRKKQSSNHIGVNIGLDGKQGVNSLQNQGLRTGNRNSQNSKALNRTTQGNLQHPIFQSQHKKFNETKITGDTTLNMKKKSLSTTANRRFSKHVSETGGLPKIQFNLEY